MINSSLFCKGNVSLWTGGRGMVPPLIGNSFHNSLAVLRLFCHCHFVIRQNHGFCSPCEPHQLSRGGHFCLRRIKYGFVYARLASERERGKPCKTRLFKSLETKWPPHSKGLLYGLESVKDELRASEPTRSPHA